MKSKLQKGIVTLPIILLIGGIVMELTIAGVVVATLINNTIFSERLSAEALAAAHAGVQDAMVKIIRYNCFSGMSIGCPSDDSLSPDVLDLSNDRIAEVYISDRMSTDSDGDGTDDTFSFVIDSVGTVLARKKRIEAKVGINPNSGKISIISLEEVPIH